MDHGKLIAFGTPEEPAGSAGSDVISFTSRAGLDFTGLRRLPFVTGVREDRPGAYSITTSNALDRPLPHGDETRTRPSTTFR
jgi:hypothetical protein